MIVVVTALLLAAVLVFVGYPLVSPSTPEAADPAVGPAVGQRERLLAEREHALATLTELEFEHSIGNLSDEDYAALQGPHRHKAVAILRELDASGDSDAGFGDARPFSLTDEQTLDARLEDEIARARAQLAGPTAPGVEAPRAAEAPRDMYEASMLCPRCHAPHAVTAHFCAECGYKLREDSNGIEHSGSMQGQGTHDG